MVRRKKSKLSRMQRLLRAVLIVVILIFGSVTAQDYIGFGSGQAKDKTVVIPQGAGAAGIASILKEEGIIRYPFFFRVLSKLGGHDSHYIQGTFQLKPYCGYRTVFRTLSDPTGGRDDIVKITIPEGYELRQIAELLAKEGLVDEKAFLKAADEDNFDFDFVRALPRRANRLEGYLFPDTYLFARISDTEHSILNAMLARFDEMINTPENRARAAELHMTQDQIVTLASIIEREALGDSDRKNVASVFHNRLKSKTFPYLQSCATIQYILKERKAVLSEADTKIKSPYNTYLNKGLPPGPIASPGLSSVEAALHPNQTGYLYFVLGSDGKHHFARTFEEHKANMKR